MAEPYMGEIRLFSFGIIPHGWAPCEGQLLNINSYQALYSILGTTYGGDGQTTFALPDLRGHAPVGFSGSIPLGYADGQERHILMNNEMPEHTHQVKGSSAGATTRTAAGKVWASADANPYAASAPTGTMSDRALGSVGGHPHNNMQPYGVVSYCIALEGFYPTRS